MIQKVFITYNGMPIIAKDYIERLTGKELNEDLIAPYISAISSFAQQVHKDDIEAIVMNKSKLLYREIAEFPGAYVLVITDREDSTLEINSKMSLLITRFCNSYSSEDLGKQALAMDNAYFDPFYLLLDEIMVGDACKIRDEFKVQFAFALNQLKENLAAVVNAIILGEKVIILGQQYQLENVIPVLEMFGYGRTLKTIFWSETNKEADILGTSHKHFRDFELGGENRIIVDLIKGKVFGGTPDPFCKNLIKDLKGLDYQNALRLINSRIQVIFSKVTSILELAHEGQLNDKMIDLFLRDVDKSARDLVLTLMGKQDIKLYELIQKYGAMEKKF